MSKQGPSAGKQEAAVVIPGPLTDFVKALREAIGAMRDVGQLVTDGVMLYEKVENNAARRPWL